MQVIRDVAPPQQDQQPPGVDEANGDVPVYAELAPSRRPTTEQAPIVNNSTAIYASIVHPPRTQQP